MANCYEVFGAPTDYIVFQKLIETFPFPAISFYGFLQFLTITRVKLDETCGMATLTGTEIITTIGIFIRKKTYLKDLTTSN